MKKKYLFVANWKMYLSFEQALEFAAQHYDDFIALTKDFACPIIICPDFTSLTSLKKIFKSTDILFGAQDCSSHARGAFTGQVCAESLRQIGCDYCIIGHSETRINAKHDDKEISNKFLQLIAQGISPIICIGEQEEDYKKGNVFQVLEKQLMGILSRVSADQHLYQDLSICIAYEPVWSIGTAQIPSQDHLNNVFSWLADKVKKNNKTIDWKLIYGGSVAPENIGFFKKIDMIDGFLIGGASVDFQKLKKIVQ
ncbi:MAG: triose-phosphate isomerase family protein [bacterium]